MTRQTVSFTSTFFNLHQVADGVYAAIAIEGAGALGNAGFIDMGEDVLVFDTFCSPQAASDMKKAIDLLIGKPVKYVINSHYHGDHIWGNQVFEGATIISTSITRKLFIEQNTVGDAAKEYEDLSNALIQMEEAAHTETDDRKRRSALLDINDKKVLLEAIPYLRQTLPTVTFEDALTIYETKRQVELITYGGGHTESDAFLYLREENLAFMADLVLVETTPYLGVGNPDEWLSILDRVKILELKTIVPGHGEVGTSEHIEPMQQYIRYVKEKISSAKEKGLSVSDVIAMDIPSPFSEWSGFMINDWNVHGLWDK